MNVWQWISTVVAGFAGSWLGGWIGVRSHRSQRSFELRVAWYQDAIGRLSVVIEQLTSAQNASERGNETECGRLLGIAMRTIGEELVPEIVKGRVFGTPATIGAIDRYIAAFGKLRLPRGGESPGFTKDETGFYDRVSDLMLSLRQNLVDDFRSVMAYERAPIVKIKSAD